MEIFRIPKCAKNATVARLTISKSSSGRIEAVLKIEGPMSGVMEHGEHETAAQAERFAAAKAEQRHASVLIIEDRT